MGWCVWKGWLRWAGVWGVEGRGGGGVGLGVGRGRAGCGGHGCGAWTGEVRWGGVGLGGGPKCGTGAAGQAERSRGSAANSPNILADALGWPIA